jgi:peptide-methionine (S)-S-oxide reductase
MRGVEKVISGYANGHLPNPTYKDVCTGASGYAEGVQVTFNPTELSYETLVRVFFATHDPTQLNQQGNDVGTQYRSGIYYVDESQKEIALKVREELSKSGAFSRPIVTEIEPLKNWYPAEAYHQDYFEHNPSQGYCSYVIKPKVEKFIKNFRDLLK